MTDLGNQLGAYLGGAALICEPERRAFGPRRGVPDALIWIHPAETTVSRCLPLLFELETFGNHYAGRDDPEKFATRCNNEEHQYHLRWPVVGELPVSRIEVTVEYELRTVSSTEVTGQFETSESNFYNAVEDWSDILKRSISPEVQQRVYNDTRVVIWRSDIRTFGGYEFEIKIPFFVEIGDNIERLVRTRFDPVSIPVLITVDGRPPEYEETLRLDTVVELRSVSPATIRRLSN